MFSVVIPLYNKELSIRETIQSVLDQTFKRFEIIVVNDGSTDQSPEIVAGFNDPRIRLIHQENQGVSTARNTGIKAAKYEWIAFLDADDLWKSGHLEEIIKMMDLFPNEKIYVTSFEFSDGRELYKNKRSTIISIIDNYFKYAMTEYVICIGTVVAQKNVIEKIGLFDPELSRGEDLDLWIKIGRAYKLVKNDKSTMIYNTKLENRLTNSRLNYNSSIISKISICNSLTKEEKLYKQKIIIQRIKILIKSKNLIDALRAIIRHNIHLIS